MWEDGWIGWVPRTGEDVVRRLLAVVAIAAFAGLLWGTTSAGAQTTLTCSFSASTNNLPVGGGPVSVSGTAPADTNVRIFVNGVLVATAPTSATGAWGPVVINITATSTITVSADNYPATPCLGNGNVNVAQAQALPRTGSDSTKPYVLAGATLLVVGLVLTIAARRRETARGRV
jgi:LPXTG-motif cell wall-anchored protein